MRSLYEACEKIFVARLEIAMRMRHVILTESYDRRIQGPAGLGCKGFEF
jgi:hypothetical protein